MNCGDATERLLELVYENEASNDAVELREHVERCVRCSAELAGLRRTRDALDGWVAPSLHTDGRGARSVTFRSFRSGLIGAAAMLGLCVTGLAVFGTVQRGAGGLTFSLPVGAATPTGDEYLLLLHAGEGASNPASPEEVKTRVTEYSAWADALHRRNRLVAAEKLDPREARSFEQVDGDLRVESIALASNRPHVAGFFHIRADSPEQAASIASECPHLRYGGRVELRRVENTKPKPTNGEPQ